MPYFCHQCQTTVQVNEHLQCSRCDSEFIEEVPTHGPQMGGDAIGGPMQFLQTLMEGVQQQQRPQGAENNPQSQQSGRGIFGSLLDSFLGGPHPSSSTSGRNQQTGDQPREPFMDFFEQLVSNLSANVAPGTQVQINFSNGPPRIHGNINNYVLGDQNFDQLITQFLNGFEQQQQGLSEENLARLPMSKITEEQVKNGQQCTTCMDDFSLDEEVAILACKHVFHEDCIVPWLKRANTCPICRTTIDPRDWAPTGRKPKTKTISDVDELD